MLVTRKMANLCFTSSIIFLIVILSSCSNVKEFTKKQNALSPDQTKSQVINIMGDDSS